MLAIRLTATSEEIGPDHMHLWRNIVKNPAGEAIAEGGGEFAIGAENPRTDWLNNFLISAAIQFEAEEEGTYTIELIVDEANSALPIHVVYEPLDELEDEDERGGAGLGEAVAASCPQAASMSRPRVRRTVTGMPLCWRRAWKAPIALELEPSKPDPVGLNGIRLTLKALGSSSVGELVGLLDAVVDAVEHHVLDEDAAVAAGVVRAAGGEHLVERVAVVDGHQLRAQRVVGGVQREGEADRALLLGQSP